MRNSSVLPEVHCFWEMSSNDKLIDHSAFLVGTIDPAVPQGVISSSMGFSKVNPTHAVAQESP